MDKQLENKLNRMGCSSAIPVIKELERENAELRQEIANHREQHAMVNIDLEEAELRAIAYYEHYCNEKVKR